MSNERKTQQIDAETEITHRLSVKVNRLSVQLKQMTTSYGRVRNQYRALRKVCRDSSSESTKAVPPVPRAPTRVPGLPRLCHPLPLAFPSSSLRTSALTFRGAAGLGHQHRTAFDSTAELGSC